MGVESGQIIPHVERLLYVHRRCASDARLIFSTITRCYDKRVTVVAVAIVAGDMEVLYGKFT